MSRLIEDAKKQLEQLPSLNKTERFLYFTGIFNRIVAEHGTKSIVVGGFAVEIYTQNSYMTQDIDLVFARNDIANQVLLDLGFEREGKSWYHSGLQISVEIPGDILHGDYDQIMKLNLPNGDCVYVIGIEDIILDRLRACVHWKSSSDCEWGYRLYKTHRENLDIDYIVRISRNDGTYQFVEKWFSE